MGKWLACSPITPKIWVWIRLKLTVLTVKIVFEKNENKQKDFYMSLCFNQFQINYLPKCSRVSSLGLQPNRWAIDTSQRLNKNLDIWAWSRTVNTEQAKHLLLPLILNSYHFRRIFSFHVGDAKNIYFCIFISRGRASNKGETR